MTFWEWAGTAVITGLSGGVGLKLVGWLKEHLDRKARNVSYHAKRLLEQADQVCGIARALQAVVHDDIRWRAQAATFWTTTSTASLLNVWLAHAWVLDTKRKLRRLRTGFESAVDRLRQAALQWHQADMMWREAIGITEREVRIGGGPDKSPEAAEKAKAALVVKEAFEAFLVEYQSLHNAVQPLVREYAGLEERAASEVKP